MSPPVARRTKIVCTIGPASRAPEFVERLAWAGMDAARLNFSHGSRDDHRAVVQAVRRAQQVIGRPLAVIADLQGPKIRIGDLAEPRAVNPGDRIMVMDHSAASITFSDGCKLDIGPDSLVTVVTARTAPASREPASGGAGRGPE